MNILFCINFLVFSLVWVAPTRAYFCAGQAKTKNRQNPKQRLVSQKSNREPKQTPFKTHVQTKTYSASVLRMHPLALSQEGLCRPWPLYQPRFRPTQLAASMASSVPVQFFPPMLVAPYVDTAFFASREETPHDLEVRHPSGFVFAPPPPVFPHARGHRRPTRLCCHQ